MIHLKYENINFTHWSTYPVLSSCLPKFVQLFLGFSHMDYEDITIKYILYNNMSFVDT